MSKAPAALKNLGWSPDVRAELLDSALSRRCIRVLPSQTDNRHLEPDGKNRVVTVVPEFVVSSWRHQLLHGQTALFIKRRLLFEKGVVAVSVPYHLEREAEAASS
jgi:hypothetical protein